MDLLSSTNSPHDLAPYASCTLPEPLYAAACHPLFSLQEPTSCLVLASLRALPLRLISPLAPGIIASYPLVSPTTEAYITPHSLLFNPVNPNHFFAGSHSCLSVFDLSRNGEGPVSTMRTTPSRRHHTAANGGMKGIVSTMAMSDEGLLAAGTFSRYVGLYDSHGRGETIGVFPIAGKDDTKESTAGDGLTQLLWSACGRYLCTVERKSDGIGVWDVRGTGRRLAWLGGRKARTQQRLGADILGPDIYAGGTDGMVRRWQGIGQAEGFCNPTWEFHAHNDAVTSSILHPTVAVIATSSGQRHFQDNDTNFSSLLGCEIEESDSTLQSSGAKRSHLTSVFDNSLKAWALYTETNGDLF